MIKLACLDKYEEVGGKVHVSSVIPRLLIKLTSLVAGANSCSYTYRQIVAI